MKKVKILSSFLGAAIAAASLTFPVLQAFAEGIGTEYRTPAQIKAYYEDHPFDLYGKTEYSVQPSSKSPYALGKLTDATQQNALASLNFVRYVAGLPEVTLNSSYCEYAQAASLVCAANNKLTHSPTQPSGMSNDMYQKGKKGASSGNLSYRSGTTYLAHILMMGYMDDSDASNIAAVGHRRWCLNPGMGQTGFGCVGSYSGMYAHDMSRYGTETNVAWPAQNMPLEYFTSWRNPSVAWSISTGQYLSADNVRVTLTRKPDGKKWTFAKSASDGYFNVDNGGYGATGCIVFRPDNISYSSGDSFDVLIEGTSEPITYSVNFFSIDEVYSERGGLTLGNVNYDKSVNASDASQVLREYSRVSTGRMGLFNSEQTKNGDVNSDGKIDAADASLILKYYSYASTAASPVSMEKWYK